MGLWGIAVNRAGTFAYATNFASNTVSVIDAATNSVVATVSVGTQPIGVAVNPAGTLVYYEKADNTQLGSATVAIDKARSAALYKRPTKAFQDGLAKGAENLRILRLTGAVPVEGGVPLIVEGKLVGAIGVSGDLSEHDNQCAMQAFTALTAAK